MAENEHGVDDEALTVDFGCPFYIHRDKYPVGEYGLPSREVNRYTFDRMPAEVQHLYERRERMPGVAKTETFVRVRKPAWRWRKIDGRWQQEDEEEPEEGSRITLREVEVARRAAARKEASHDR